MAEETLKATAAGATEKAEDVVTISDVPAAEKPATDIVHNDAPPQPEPEPVPEAVEKPAAVEEEKPEEKITESASFKEESNVVGELPDPQRKALDDLKQMVQEALNKHEFTAPPPLPPAKEEEKPTESVEVEPASTEGKPESEIQVKPLEKADVPPEPAPASDEPPPQVVEEEPPKAETEAVAETPVKATEKDETAPPPPPAAETSEPAVVAVEKVEAVIVDEHGSKTVEEIKETIVEVAIPAPPPETPAPEAPVAESKEEAEIQGQPLPPPEAVSIWGVPLLADERSDVILLKFLRARDFKVKEAFSMLKSVVSWRKEFGIETLIEEELGSGLEKVVYMHGFDKEGHPVCYNAFGEFLDKELYQNTFSDEEKRTKFLRWRIQFLENSIRKLDFSPDGICTLVQVNDLKNSPGPFKRELRQATNQALQLLQDNYPEFVAKQVFINVPWWYLAFYRMISPFFTQRTKSKFVFAGPSKTAETLFKYIAPEQVPVQYGGLSREGEQEFTTADPATEEIIKPATKHVIQFEVTEGCTLVWEVRVVGWDVSYGAEFLPAAEGGYTVIVQKSRKISPTDEQIICNSFKSGEAGKVVLTFDNQTSKKKKLLYRSKNKPAVSA